MSLFPALWANFRLAPRQARAGMQHTRLAPSHGPSGAVLGRCGTYLAWTDPLLRLQLTPFSLGATMIYEVGECRPFWLEVSARATYIQPLRRGPAMPAPNLNIGLAG